MRGIRKNEDGSDIIEKGYPQYEWVGTHRVERKTGYCKPCDGPCENVVDARGVLEGNDPFNGNMK